MRVVLHLVQIPGTMDTMDNVEEAFDHDHGVEECGNCVCFLKFTGIRRVCGKFYICIIFSVSANLLIEKLRTTFQNPPTKLLKLRSQNCKNKQPIEMEAKSFYFSQEAVHKKGGGKRESEPHVFAAAYLHLSPYVGAGINARSFIAARRCQA